MVSAEEWQQINSLNLEDFIWPETQSIHSHRYQSKAKDETFVSINKSCSFAWPQGQYAAVVGTQFLFLRSWLKKDVSYLTASDFKLDSQLTLFCH